VWAACKDNQGGWQTAFGIGPAAERPVLRAETHVDGYPPAIHEKSHNAMAPVNKKVYFKQFLSGFLGVF
jgi:hypothetical protein